MGTPKSYFLYCWIVNGGFWFPVKIYQSKSYARKVAESRGYLRYKIVTRTFGIADRFLLETKNHR